MAYVNPYAGKRREGWPPAEPIDDVAAEDATSSYGEDTAELVNELKAKVNAILAAVRAAGIVAESSAEGGEEE